MRDFTRRLSALEVRMGNRQFRRVEIVSGDDPAPIDNDDIHVIRIVAAAFPGPVFDIPRQHRRASRSELTA